MRPRGSHTGGRAITTIQREAAMVGIDDKMVDTKYPERDH